MTFRSRASRKILARKCRRQFLFKSRFGGGRERRKEKKAGAEAAAETDGWRTTEDRRYDWE